MGMIYASNVETLKLLKYDEAAGEKEKQYF